MKNLIGEVFTKLRVLEKVAKKNNKTNWLCGCECGKTKVVDQYSLLRGVTHSCGCWTPPTIKPEIGDIFRNAFGTQYRVYEIKSYNEVLVEFLDEFGYKKSTISWNCVHGAVENPYDRKAQGVGYFGEGRHKGTGSDFKKYKTWCSMMDRCYDNKALAYTNCSVAEIWHNYQNYGDWFEENYVEGWALDKDLFSDFTGVYSPENCCFLPRKINNIIKGCLDDIYSGVVYHSRDNLYQSTMSKKYFKRQQDALVSQVEGKCQRIMKLIDDHRHGLSARVQEKLEEYCEVKQKDLKAALEVFNQTV